MSGPLPVVPIYAGNCAALTPNWVAMSDRMVCAGVEVLQTSAFHCVTPRAVTNAVGVPAAACVLQSESENAPCVRPAVANITIFGCKHVPEIHASSAEHTPAGYVALHAKSQLPVALHKRPPEQNPT